MSSRDHPDWWKPVGGANAQDSTLERRSLMWNDNGILDGTVPPANYTTPVAKGKFFTRGCRGMIERIEVYCTAAGAHNLNLRWSPHPGIGPVGEDIFIPAVGWAWQGVDVEEMWNYDSLFVWVYYGTLSVQVGYDTEEPYDGHESDIDGATWAATDTRLFIRVIYTGETPGDVPVSGIVNVIPIPSASSRHADIDREIAADGEFMAIDQEGAGYCDYVKAVVAAAVNSHVTFIRIYCDLVLAMEEQFEELNNDGHTTSTPTVSLSLYAEDGICAMLIHKRFEFRRVFQVRLYNALNAQTVTVTTHPTFME